MLVSPAKIWAKAATEVNRPAVSVIVAAFADDRWDDTIRAIQSVGNQTLPVAEIILVIDHNPGLFSRAAEALPGARVVENEHPRGASGARNTGVHASSSELVAFLDDDAVASPSWLANSVPHFAQPDVVGVGGKITPVWETSPPRWFPDELLWVVGASYRGMPRKAAPVRNVWAGNMVVRRAAFDKADGFRVDFGKKGDREDFQAEDTDFCLRAARAWPAGAWIYEPQAQAAHKVPVRRSTWRFLITRCYHEGRNKVLLADLVGPEGMSREKRHVAITLPRGVLLEFGAAMRGDLYGLACCVNIDLAAAAAIAGVAITSTKHRPQRPCQPEAQRAPGR